MLPGGPTAICSSRAEDLDSAGAPGQGQEGQAGLRRDGAEKVSSTTLLGAAPQGQEEV